MNRRLLGALLWATVLSGCLSRLPPPALDPMIGRSGEPSVPSEVSSATPDTDPSSWKALDVRPVEWKPPRISQFADTLRPGVVIYWVRDSSLPLASVRFVWPEGRLALSSDQDAAAALLGGLLVRGGTSRFTPAQLDDTLEFLAAGVSVSIGMVRSTANVSGLSRDLPFLLSVLEDALVAPRLDTARISVAVSERIQDIEHRFDTPAQALSLGWDRVANGPGPWTELADSVEIRKVDARALRAARAGRFSGRKVWIAVAGQVDQARIRQQLSDLLDRLDAGPHRLAPQARLDSVPGLPAMTPPGVVVVDKSGNQ
ncbi:MAG TPA: hypothetical protein PKO15_18280, partial [Fibrobacteria bacterium]|nr:hypothetical protein [Fibrobacteria bacterium]